MSVEVFDLSVPSDHALLSHQGARHLLRLSSFLKVQKPNGIAVLRVSDSYRGGGFPPLGSTWIEQYTQGLGSLLAALEDLNTCAAHTYFVVPSECVGLAWLFGLYAGVRLQNPAGVVGVGYSGVVRSALLTMLPRKLTGGAVNLVQSVDASLHDPAVLPLLPLGYWRTIEFLEGAVLFETESEPFEGGSTEVEFELTRSRHAFLRLMVQKSFQAFAPGEAFRVAFELPRLDATLMGCLADFLRAGAYLEMKTSAEIWKKVENHFSNDRKHLGVRFRSRCLRCERFLRPGYYDFTVCVDAQEGLIVNGLRCIRIASGKYESSVGHAFFEKLGWSSFVTAEWFPLSERVRKVFWLAIDVFLEHYRLDRTRSERYLERDGWRVPMTNPSNVETMGICDDVDWLAIATHLRSGHLAMYAAIILDEIMQGLNQGKIFESQDARDAFLTATFFVVPGFYPRPSSPERQYLLKHCQ